MVIRFFGSIICSIVLAVTFVGVAALYKPYDHLDTWGDVWRDVISCGTIGAVAGLIVGMLWSLDGAIRRPPPDGEQPLIGNPDGKWRVWRPALCIAVSLAVVLGVLTVNHRSTMNGAAPWSAHLVAVITNSGSAALTIILTAALSWALIRVLAH